MSADESPMIAAERRTRRRMAVGVKQFAAVLTTTGYATVAGGGWQPLLDNKPLRLVHALMFCFGVACLAVRSILRRKERWMSGTEQVQWLMIAFAVVMIVVGLWMKHGMDKLNRRIADAEQQQSLSPHVHPAE